MRILIDMQGAQTESRFRGIGRYTLSFAQAIVRNRSENEVILALSGLFPDTIEPIRAAFNDLLPQENILVWHAPGPVKTSDASNENRREVAELLREAFLSSLQPDVIHVCSLFEGYVDDAVTSFSKFESETITSVTVHDLIPLLNPEKYLNSNDNYKKHYIEKLNYIENCDTILAVSESAKKEATTNIKIDDKKIFNTLEAVEPYFKKIYINSNDQINIKHKFSISKSFLLYTGGSDERKNLPRLIQAYARLPKAQRQTHQLVFAGRMGEGDIAQFKHTAQTTGLNDGDLVFTGYVSDEQLVQLYNLCSLYVFPSWHEGFGLPALEAMACGAAVIGANTSSLPEVIGLQEAMFDPMDVDAICAKMEQVLSNEEFCQRLRKHGLEQAKKFSWDETAKRALMAWKSCTENNNTENTSWKAIEEKLKVNYTKIISRVATFQDNAKNEEIRITAKCLYENERQTYKFYRSKKLPEVITWRIEGPFDSSYSLALLNREISKAMSSLGHRVVLHSTEGPGDYPANKEFLVANPLLAEMHRLAYQVTGWDANITSRNLYPPRVTEMNSPLNFLHAYGWEESGFPLDWIDDFNQSLQGMTVMSKHVADVMVNHGFTKPIRISSIGVDHWLTFEPDSRYKLKAKSFRFLHVSSCFPRKGADVMLRAYGQAFRDTDDVTLVIKTFSNPHNEIYRWLKESQAGDPHYPDVQIIESDFTDSELKALYGQCQVLVAPSRAEGFGLPMAEAMLSGLAVITTGWSGQTDFCTEETAWLIDYTFEKAQSHFGIFSSVWAEPDEIHLSKLMKEIRNTPQEELAKRTNVGQKLLLQKFRWVHAAKRLVEAARQCSSRVIDDEPRIGWISTWNTKCGIATYSQHLIQNMDQPVSVLAPHAADFINNDTANVFRSWSIGDDDDLIQLEQTIDRLGLNTLMIQFNYGFFNLQKFTNFLIHQYNLGRSVAVTLHSTSDQSHAPDKKLSIILPGLKSCSRVLVHSIKDLNRLKQLGLIDNLTLIPHGVLDYIPAQNKTNVKNNIDSFTVASYGFFLPHKGLLELIEAVELLKKQNWPIKLKMVNSEYPAIESSEIIQEAHKKISKLNISDVVELHTTYLEDHESLALLSSADIIIFPYQETGESASGAVRYGIATGLPVLVTPLPIFDDVAAAVHKLPGTSALDIANGIKELARKLRAREDTVIERESSADRWRKEHSYTRVGQRVGNLLSSLVLNSQLDLQI
jgi:glycosyltransferase involved in cell wall biosynthesis